MATANAAVLTLANTSRPVDVDLAPSAVVRHLCHELRQPLSTIESAAFYLQMVLSPDRRASQELERIQEMVRQIDWILMDVVHYVQAATPRAEWVDLAEIVTTEVATAGLSRYVDLEWAESGVAPLVLIDPGQAAHMVRSVLTVFRQTAKPNSRVRLSLWREGKYVELKCRCAAEEKLLECAEDLMLPFTPHLPAGSGLALAGAQRIAETHQGSAQLQANDGELELTIRLIGH